MAEPTPVEAYLAALPERPRAVLEALRGTIRAAAPGATETIAYDMPALRIGDRFLVSYAAYRQHCSLYPASGAVRDALGDALKPYLSGKATIRFRLGEPLPADLVTKIVEIRLAEVRKPPAR